MGPASTFFAIYGFISDMRRVALLLHDGMRIFDYAIATEVWGPDRPGAGSPRFDLRLCSARRRAVTADAGARVRATHGLTALGGADLVVVPGGRPGAADDRCALAALRSAHRAGTPIAALYDGALLLARAGLLHGRRATAHWSAAGELRRRFPEVRLRPNALFVEDGGIWTSAGAAAGIDLCLHLVREAHGARAAAAVAHRMVTAAQRSGDQPQHLAAPPAAPPRHDRAVAEAIAWAREHLHEPISVRRLADRARMSERTFARRFARTTATTPLRWLHQQRTRLAQYLLETTDLPVEAIAHRSGFGSTAVLRRHFGRLLGTTPSAYRDAHAERQRTAAAPPPGGAPRNETVRPAFSGSQAVNY